MKPPVTWPKLSPATRRSTFASFTSAAWCAFRDTQETLPSTDAQDQEGARYCDGRYDGAPLACVQESSLQRRPAGRVDRQRPAKYSSSTMRKIPFARPLMATSLSLGFVSWQQLKCYRHMRQVPEQLAPCHWKRGISI